MRALEAFGFGSIGLTAADFQISDQIIQLGRAAYLKNKCASGRPQDIADASRLSEMYGEG